MTVTRRRFLQGASALSAASLTGVTSSLTSFNSLAQQAEDYRALVCVFLFGGMDNHDFILPYDRASYDQFADIRQSFLSVQGANRQRDNLLALNPGNTADFGGRQFALPPEMPQLKSLFDQGNAAIVGNVGPLIEPTSLQQFALENVRLPPRLFSHNDQQATWQASSPEGAQFGWGGLFADTALTSNSDSGKAFTTIATEGSALFLTGNDVQPYSISLDGAANIGLLEELEFELENPVVSQLFERMRNHFSATDFSSAHLLERDAAAVLRNAFNTNQSYNQARESLGELDTPFPPSFLGQQLRSVAETIAIRDTLGVNRQVFFVGIGGFDTHSAQATDLPRLQSQLDAGIAAFYQSMQDMGLGANVTLFTASDFGRTLAVNGDGTDHGWGAHHVVVGDAVNGGLIFGNLPPPTFGHEWDVGGGRLLPSVSVEQFAAPLGRWFGLSETQVANALPNLANFADVAPGFI